MVDHRDHMASIMAVLSLEPAEAYRQLLAGLAVLAWSIPDDTKRGLFFDTVRADLPIFYGAIAPEFEAQFQARQKAKAAGGI